jgi:hypothetical protein
VKEADQRLEYEEEAAEMAKKKVRKETGNGGEVFSYRTPQLASLLGVSEVHARRLASKLLADKPEFCWRIGERGYRRYTRQAIEFVAEQVGAPPCLVERLA